ncbi:Retrovirus-related Pol polyprotein from transposon RE1 [Vitis vinifera]|uniref:Retrovirus-related Pol polyprotein from transposon RE1 n=1 Tax=Vitis vinifera TaxID=29760 RepID=A0A438DXR8_VITVI|nr:Retrovirus-related Pol polyprotein from transposon RE1 [Vitis vinifera]
MSHQGENLESEEGFRELKSQPSSIPSAPEQPESRNQPESESIELPNSTHLNPVEPTISLTQHISETWGDPERQELCVYSRRIKPQRQLPIMERHCQKPELSVTDLQNNPDAKNALLNRELNEEVYMDSPPSLEDNGRNNLAYKLKRNDLEEMERLKGFMAREFEIEDHGPPRHFLGMEVKRSRNGIVLSQRKCTLNLQKETSRYQRLVSELIYLSHTQLDIAFAMSVELEERKLEAFTNMNWVGSIEDRQSISGSYTFVWGNLVTWKSKKQSVATRSSVEAKFRVMALGIFISIAHNLIHHDRTKHVEVDRYFIKVKIKGGMLNVEYVPTREQAVDILTEGLPHQNFDELTSKLSLLDIYSPA